MYSFNTSIKNEKSATCVNKAGSILINTTSKNIGIIYRKKQQDFSFPKGHQELNETPFECAKRETIEETQRDIEILTPLQVQKYTSKKGKHITVHWFLAKDLGPTIKMIAEDLKHELIWVELDQVIKKLSYKNLKQLFKSNEQIIKNFLTDNEVSNIKKGTNK